MAALAKAERQDAGSLLEKGHKKMERLTHKRSNGIKEGYWSPNKKDELAQRLAEYENTGLTSEQVHELKE